MTRAWRKRLARGENAINVAGAVSRHRPHFRDGIKAAKSDNRLHGGNNKKAKFKREHSRSNTSPATEDEALLPQRPSERADPTRPGLGSSSVDVKPQHVVPYMIIIVWLWYRWSRGT